MEAQSSSAGTGGSWAPITQIVPPPEVHLPNPAGASMQGGEWWANNESFEQAMALYVKGVEPLVNLPPGFRQGLYVLPANSSSNLLESAQAHSTELEQVHNQHMTATAFTPSSSSNIAGRLPSPHVPSRPSPLTLGYADPDHLRSSNSSLASPGPQSLSSTASSSNSSPSGSWVSVKRELESESEKCRKNAGITDDALAGPYKELLDMMGWSKEREAEAKKKRIRGSGNEDHKRAKHIASEKKRRGDMNEAILMLRDLVPPIRDATKATKIDVLHETADFLQRIQQTACFLVQENKRLNAELSQVTGRSTASMIPQPQQQPQPQPQPQPNVMPPSAPSSQALTHAFTALGLHPHAFAALSLNSSPPTHHPPIPHNTSSNSPHLGGGHPLAHSQPLPQNHAHVFGQAQNLLRHNGSHLARDTSRFMMLSLFLVWSVYGFSSLKATAPVSAASSGSTSRILLGLEVSASSLPIPSLYSILLQLLISGIVFVLVFVGFVVQDAYILSAETAAELKTQLAQLSTPRAQGSASTLLLQCLVAFGRAPSDSLFSKVIFVCYQLMRLVLCVVGIAQPIEAGLARVFSRSSDLVQTEAELLNKYLRGASSASQSDALTFYGVALAGLCTALSSRVSSHTKQSFVRALESQAPFPGPAIVTRPFELLRRYVCSRCIACSSAAIVQQEQRAAELAARGQYQDALEAYSDIEKLANANRDSTAVIYLTLGRVGCHLAMNSNAEASALLESIQSDSESSRPPQQQFLFMVFSLVLGTKGNNHPAAFEAQLELLQKWLSTQEECQFSDRASFAGWTTLARVLFDSTLATGDKNARAVRLALAELLCTCVDRLAASGDSFVKPAASRFSAQQAHLAGHLLLARQRMRECLELAQSEEIRSEEELCRVIGAQLGLLQSATPRSGTTSEITTV